MSSVYKSLLTLTTVNTSQPSRTAMNRNYTLQLQTRVPFGHKHKTFRDNQSDYANDELKATHVESRRHGN